MRTAFSMGFTMRLFNWGFIRALLVLFYLGVSMYYLTGVAEVKTSLYPESFYPKKSIARFAC